MHDRFVQGAKPTKEHFAYIIPQTYSNVCVRDSQADWGNLRSKWGGLGTGKQICWLPLPGTQLLIAMFTQIAGEINYFRNWNWRFPDSSPKMFWSVSNFIVNVGVSPSPVLFDLFAYFSKSPYSPIFLSFSVSPKAF